MRGTARAGMTPGARPAGSRGAGGGAGGGGGASTDYLLAHLGSAKYLVAATGSQTTARISLDTGKAVVTSGGFSGSDPAPTVSRLAAMVKAGELRYVLLPSSTGQGGPGTSSTALTSWVEAHGTAVSGLGRSGGTLYRVSA